MAGEASEENHSSSVEFFGSFFGCVVKVLSYESEVMGT